MEPNTKRKLVRSTQQQLAALLDYMGTHKRFANGEYMGSMGHKQHINEWEELRAYLRELGPDKTVEQWRTTWRDMKKRARTDGGRVRLAQAQTGNNTDIPKLSTTTEKVLEIIGKECSLGIDVEETGIEQVIIAGPSLTPPPVFSTFSPQSSLTHTHTHTPNTLPLNIISNTQVCPPHTSSSTPRNLSTNRNTPFVPPNVDTTTPKIARSQTPLRTIIKLSKSQLKSNTHVFSYSIPPTPQISHTSSHTLSPQLTPTPPSSNSPPHTITSNTHVFSSSIPPTPQISHTSSHTITPQLTPPHSSNISPPTITPLSIFPPQSSATRTSTPSNTPFVRPNVDTTRRKRAREGPTLKDLVNSDGQTREVLSVISNELKLKNRLSIIKNRRQHQKR